MNESHCFKLIQQGEIYEMLNILLLVLYHKVVHGAASILPGTKMKSDGRALYINEVASFRTDWF